MDLSPIRRCASGRRHRRECQMPASSLVTETADLLARLGVVESAYTGGSLAVASPITGERIADVRETNTAE